MRRDRRSRTDVFGPGPSTRRGIQIGPRIRIGGTVGKIGQNIKTGVGKVLSNPIVEGGLSLIPGVGPIGSAIAGGLGRALDTTGGSVGLGDIAGGALQGGVSGIGAGALKGALSGGLSLGNILKSAPQLAGLFGSAGGVANGGLGLGNLLDLGLGGAQAVNAAQLQNKANQYATNAQSAVQDSYNERAPLRAQGLGMIQNPGAGVNLGGLRKIAATGGPFARAAG